MAEHTSSLRVFASPSRYVQGRDAMAELGSLVGKLGKAPLVLTDDVVRDLTGQTLERSFERAQVPLTFERFGGIPTKAESERVAEVIREGGHDIPQVALHPLAPGRAGRTPRGGGGRPTGPHARGVGRAAATRAR